MHSIPRYTPHVYITFSHRDWWVWLFASTDKKRHAGQGICSLETSQGCILCTQGYSRLFGIVWEVVQFRLPFAKVGLCRYQWLYSRRHGELGSGLVQRGWVLNWRRHSRCKTETQSFILDQSRISTPVVRQPGNHEVVEWLVAQRVFCRFCWDTRHRIPAPRVATRRIICV